MRRKATTVRIPINGVELVTSVDDAVSFMLRVAAGEIDEDAAEGWIRAHLQP